jgi:hypothetical protein
MYETAKLYRGWPFNRDSDSDSEIFFLADSDSDGVGAGFRGPLQVSNEKTTFFSVSQENIVIYTFSIHKYT